MTLILLTVLLITVNAILPPVDAPDWFQHTMQLKEWKSKDDTNTDVPSCVSDLIELNRLKPDGWESFTPTEETVVLDCMLLHTKLASPSKLATDMEPLCGMMLKGYTHFTWNYILLGKVRQNFIDCLTDRILNYELEDTFQSSEIKIGNLNAVQWTRKN